MKRVLLALLLPIPVLAGTVTLSWTPPTKNTDGTDLTDLAGFRIYMGQSTGAYDEGTVDIDNPGITSYVWSNLPRGTYHFVATAYNESGLESDYSNEAIKVVDTLSTIADTEAYSILKLNDKIELLPVGTVPRGTDCDQNYSVNGKYVVPVSTVQFYSPSTKSYVVVAECH